MVWPSLAGPKSSFFSYSLEVIIISSSFVFIWRAALAADIGGDPCPVIGDMRAVASFFDVFSAVTTFSVSMCRCMFCM